MHAEANQSFPAPIPAPARKVIYKTAGHGRGGITRLVSPGDLGEHMKPFIFLDLFDLKANSPKMGMHPHSGIATVSVILDGTYHYHETTGNEGTVGAGGVEWMSAGGGVWHEGNAADGSHVRGFQLWLALPEEDENGPAHSDFLTAAQVPHTGPAGVVLGSYDGVTSPLKPRAPINYLVVKLQDRESWRYTPPAGHDVAFVAVASGKVHTAGVAIDQEVAMFEPGEAAIDFVAEGTTEFVLGSAPRHPHELVSGYYSVHTTRAALDIGEREIERLGRHHGVGRR
jgi:redox-sensitive bicupin YhaK (pirin superfamily)